MSPIGVLSRLDDTTPVRQRRVTGLAFQGARSFPVFGRVGVLTSLPFHEQRTDPPVWPRPPRFRKRAANCSMSREPAKQAPIMRIDGFGDLLRRFTDEDNVGVSMTAEYAEVSAVG